MITETVGGFEPTSPLAAIQKHHIELQRSKIEIIPQKTRAEDQQTQGAHQYCSTQRHKIKGGTLPFF